MTLVKEDLKPTTALDSGLKIAQPPLQETKSQAGELTQGTVDKSKNSPMLFSPFSRKVKKHLHNCGWETKDHVVKTCF